MKNLIKSFLALLLMFSVSCKKDPSQEVEAELKTAAENLNKMAPQVIGDGVRLDKATVDGNKTLHYHYTLTEDEVDKVTPQEIEDFKNLLKGESIKKVKSSEDMATIRENGVTLKYSYHDKNGKPLLDFEITPKDYQ